MVIIGPNKGGVISNRSLVGLDSVLIGTATVIIRLLRKLNSNLGPNSMSHSLT